MTVARDDHGSRPGVALLDHDLVADTSSGGVEVNTVRLGEGLDLGILGQVGGGLVLDVVVEGEDGLRGAVDGRQGEGSESARQRGWSGSPQS